MELYVRNVRFCLICNYVNRIIPAIRSRCTGFRFAPLQDVAVRTKLLEIAQMEKLVVTPCGVEALLRTAAGDMRRVLNCMQASSLSHPGSELTAEVVHLTLGLPLPMHVDKAFDSLFTDSFLNAFETIKAMMQTHGFAVQDFVTALYQQSLLLQWPNTVAVQLFDRLACIEERLSAGANDEIQLSTLVAAFLEARFTLTALKSPLPTRVQVQA
eukprot:GHVT01005243.1.p2 GENE.GHVT01005243.1~~GHVT01005243.1.p2  ORF type:complete len:213 (-),score=51.96 GHVT01005243.1:348-986(-)